MHCRGEKTFSYHNAGGYMNMMLGLVFAFPVEIIGVHILVAQVSVIVASIITVLSIYASIWLLGDARARVMRPVAIGNDYVRLECGIQMETVIPLSTIEKVCFSEGEIDDLAKADKLNYGTFYQANIWIVTKRPVAVRTLLGMRRAKAIGLSLDDPQALVREIREIAKG